MSSCSFEQPTLFSDKALNDIVYSEHNNQLTIEKMLEKHKGKKVFIDVWASWCGDCVKGLKYVKILQKKYPDVVFLFLSVDKNKVAWKQGIRRFQISGSHYNLPKGMKNGDFVDFINLNWIPRYMVVDEIGQISLFKATNAADIDIEKVLNANQ